MNLCLWAVTRNAVVPHPKVITETDRSKLEKPEAEKLQCLLIFICDFACLDTHCSPMQGITAVESLREAAPMNVDAIALHILVLQASQQDSKNLEQLMQVFALNHALSNASC